MTPEQRAALETIEGFTWTPHADAWAALMRDWIDFVDTYGRVPRRRDDDARARRLAVWAAEQRSLYAGISGRNPPIPERVTELGALPLWYWTDRAVTKMTGIEKFESFVARNSVGTLIGPADATDLVDSAELHRVRSWLAQQRVKLRRRSLDSDVKARIEIALGVELEPAARRKSSALAIRPDGD